MALTEIKEIKASENEDLSLRLPYKTVSENDPYRILLFKELPTEAKKREIANSGIDFSNIKGEDNASLLPKNPDASAKSIHDDMGTTSGLSSEG